MTCAHSTPRTLRAPWWRARKPAGTRISARPTGGSSFPLLRADQFRASESSADRRQQHQSTHEGRLPHGSPPSRDRRRGTSAGLGGQGGSSRIREDDNDGNCPGARWTIDGTASWRQQSVPWLTASVPTRLLVRGSGAFVRREECRSEPCPVRESRMRTCRESKAGREIHL